MAPSPELLTPNTDPHTAASSPEPKISKSQPLSWPLLLSTLALSLSVGAVAVTIRGMTHPPDIVTMAAPNPTTYQNVLNSDHSKLFSDSTNLIADVAETVAPSVVNIDVTKRGRTVVQPMPFNDDLFERFFGTMPPTYGQRTPTQRGNGSGVVLSKEGHILTNNHVVSGADEIMVSFTDGRKAPARIVGQDAMSDIAVLKVDNIPNLKPAPLGNSGQIRPGEWVIAVGSPLGFSHTVTLGIISAVSRQVPDINSNVDFIQTDAAINPGNSGGPLVNLKGEVIGINTAIIGTGQNIGFAIPSNTVRTVTEQLIKSGSVTRPWIGITMTDLTPPLAQSLGLSESTEGVVIAQVFPNSPAERAGFRQGDVIQRINGKPVGSSHDLQEFIRTQPLQTTLSMQILRNGQMMAVGLKTEKLPEQALNNPSRP